MASEREIIRQLEAADVTVRPTDTGFEVYNAGNEELIHLASQLCRLTRLKVSFAVGDPLLQGPELRFLRGHQNLRELNVYGMPISGEHLAILPTLPKLQVLHCTPMDNGAEGLKHIGSCRNLHVLGMENSQIPDAALDALAALEELRDLRLSGNPISSGVRVVRHLTRLTHLSLEETCVADDDLRAVSELKQLETLFIGSPNVTDIGVEYLTSCSRLETLGLESAKVTPAGIRRLVRLPRLKSLYIRETHVDKELFDALSMLKQLHDLSCRGEGTSAKIRRDMQELIPACDILWLGKPEDDE
jgi:Leucine-rich repeat (LRR) protein